MIISLEKAKELIEFKGWTDARIEMKLKAVEQAIRKYTNNNFQNIECRRVADIKGNLFVVEALTPFNVGDTVQVSESATNSGLYTVNSVDDSTFTVSEDVVSEEDDVLVTKVEYPDDVVECAINMLDWAVKNGSKIGIKSETLSRHSVTYEDSATLFMGYPVGILSGLKLYRKVRC